MKVTKAYRHEQWPLAAHKRGVLRAHEETMVEPQVHMVVDHPAVDEGHVIVASEAAIQNRMQVYNTDAEGALEAILKEHAVRLGDLEPHNETDKGIWGGEHPDVDLDVGSHVKNLDLSHL